MFSILDKIKQWRAIPGLLKDLKGDDRDRFAHAVMALSDAGWRPRTEEEKLLYYYGTHEWNELAAMGPVAVPILLKELKGDDSGRAVRALRDAGWKPRTEEEKLLYYYKTYEWNELAAMGPVAVPILLKELEDDGYCSGLVGKALGTIKDSRAVPGLVMALQPKGWHKGGAEAAAAALGEIGDRAAIPGLLDASKLAGWHLRKSFVGALTKIGWRAGTEEERILYYSATEQWDELVRIGGPAVPGLLEVMGIGFDKERSVVACDALVRVGSAAVPQLLESLKDPGGSLGDKANVVRILGRIRDPLAVPGLLQELARKGGWSVRDEAAAALGEIGDASAVPGLLDAFNADEDDHLRQESMWALVKLGEAAVPGLVKMLRDRKTYLVSRSAAEALGAIKDRAAVPGLLDVLESRDWALRYYSANALTKIGWLPQTEEKKILYYCALQNWDELVKIGKASAAILLEALSPDASYGSMLGAEANRLGAEAALVKIGSAIVPELLEVLRAGHWTVRVPVIRVLGKLQEPRALPGLLEALRENNPYPRNLREVAAETLGEIGDAQAIPGLTDALKDPDADVRWLAAEAIEKIEDAVFIKSLGEGKGTEDAAAIPDLLVALRKAQIDARAKRALEIKEQWATLPRRNHIATPFRYAPLYAEYNSISDTLFKRGHPRGGFIYELVLKQAAHGESDADEESHYYPDQYEWVKKQRNS